MKGRSEGFWVIATNPAHSWIHQQDFRDVAGHARLPGGTRYVPLHRDGPGRRPGSPGRRLGRKEGTFINSERRVGLLKKVKRAPGQALARTSTSSSLRLDY